MAYKPIGDYGVIGDLHIVALVGKDGSINWCCFPHFDSPSLFGALLDDQRGDGSAFIRVTMGSGSSSICPRPTCC